MAKEQEQYKLKLSEEAASVGLRDISSLLDAHGVTVTGQSSGLSSCYYRTSRSAYGTAYTLKVRSAQFATFQGAFEDYIGKHGFAQNRLSDDSTEGPRYLKHFWRQSDAKRDPVEAILRASKKDVLQITSLDGGVQAAPSRNVELCLAVGATIYPKH